MRRIGASKQPVRGRPLKDTLSKAQQGLYDRILKAGANGYTLRAGSPRDAQADYLERKGLIRLTGAGIDKDGEPTNVWGPK